MTSPKRLEHAYEETRSAVENGTDSDKERALIADGCEIVHRNAEEQP